jgi:hypothetical protein
MLTITLFLFLFNSFLKNKKTVTKTNHEILTICQKEKTVSNVEDTEEIREKVPSLMGLTV